MANVLPWFWNVNGSYGILRTPLPISQKLRHAIQHKQKGCFYRPTRLPLT
jgi:hypothetical protein